MLVVVIEVAFVMRVPQWVWFWPVHLFLLCFLFNCSLKEHNKNANKGEKVFSIKKNKQEKKNLKIEADLFPNADNLKNISLFNKKYWDL